MNGFADAFGLTIKWLTCSWELRRPKDHFRALRIFPLRRERREP